MMLQKTLPYTLLFASLALAGCETMPASDSKPMAKVEKPVIKPMSKKEDMAKPKQKAAKWGYGEPGSVAPENWGDLEVNKLCQSGVEQSPINITNVYQYEENADGSISIKHDLVPQDFDIVNNGHTIVYNATNPKASKTTVNGKVFNLLQFHYHIPSEHTVMKAHYPLEIHYVHQASDGQLAVVGVLYNVGKHNQALEKVIKDLPKENQKGMQVTNFNIGNLFPIDNTAYAYDGSLTTPPCSEKVQWLLKEQEVEVSKEQIHKLAMMYSGNNRPIQPQGDRIVKHTHTHGHHGHAH